MSQAKYKRNEVEFRSPVGVGAFLSVLPGHAKESAKKDSLSYKMELWVRKISTTATEGDDGSLYRAVATVAYHDCPDQANWEKYVFGRKGTFQTLEEKAEEGTRELGKYPRAQGCYVLTISNTMYPHTVGMKDANLADPAVREEYIRKIKERAPLVMKWCDPNSESEMDRFDARNRENMLKGIAPTPREQAYRTLIPCLPGEFWPGCSFQVTGHAYYSAVHKRPLLSLGHILLVAQGERLTAESSPDEAFSAFAPPAHLAPPGAIRPPAPAAPAAPSFMAPPAAPQQEAWAI